MGIGTAIGIGAAAIGIPTAIGAAGGAFIGARENTGRTSDYTKAGAVAGALAVPALGIAGAIGAIGVYNADKIVNGVGHLGKALYSTGDVLLNEAGRTGYGSAARMMNGVAKGAGSLIKHTPATSVWDESKKAFNNTSGKYRLSKLGWGAIGAAGIAGSLMSAVDTYDQARMGVRDEYITQAAPKIPSYKEDGGASGDLVFALNRNRRG